MRGKTCYPSTACNPLSLTRAIPFMHESAGLLRPRRGTLLEENARASACLLLLLFRSLPPSCVCLWVCLFPRVRLYLLVCFCCLFVCSFFFVCSSLLSFVCECIYFRLWDSRVSLVSLLFLPCVHVCVYSHIWDSLPENRLFSLLSILSFVLLKVFMSVVCVCLRFCYFLLVFSA